MSATREAPVLLIGLDAAEVRLIEQWMADGTLPRLAALRSRGAYGHLASTADWLVGSPWPSFYTSSWPTDHGLFHYLQWRPRRMTHERPSESWLPLRPFWRELSSQNIQTITIDVPLTYAPPPFDGVELGGWGAHDKLWPPAANPPTLMRSVNREFGRPPIGFEIAGLQSVAQLFRLRDQLVEAPRRITDLALGFMQRYPWDLLLIVLSATHRAGHKLWSDSSVRERPSPREKPEFDAALRQVYVACDEAVGRLIDAAPPDAHIMVFSLHGTGPNESRNVVLPQMLELILRDVTEGQSDSGGYTPGLLWRIRERIPVEWRSAIKSLLPHRVQDRLALFWRRYEHAKWSLTRAFAPSADLEGYVQVNLKGREVQGVVEPSEYEPLLATIQDGLFSFVDEDTGEKVVDRIVRPSELYPAGPKVDQIADLIVRWVDSPAHVHRAIVSPRYGRVSWPTPGKNPDGRPGHHRSTGWLIAAGPDLQSGTTIPEAHILDLAPTALALLDVEPPYPMRGRPIPALVQQRDSSTRPRM